MKYTTINRITDIVFLEDNNMIHIGYEDMCGKNIDAFVLKHIAEGSSPKSFVVKNTKYFIKDVDKTGIERHPYISTTGRSTDAMRDKSLLFKLRGRCVNPKKEYMPMKLQTGITEIDKLIEGRIDPSSFTNFTAHIPNPCVDANALYNSIKREYDLEQQLLILERLVNADKQASYEVEDFDRSFLIEMQFKIYRAASSRKISPDVMNHLKNGVEIATSVNSKGVADAVYICYEYILSSLGCFEKESPVTPMDNSAYFMYPGSIVKEKLNMIASYHGSGHHKAEEDETVLGNLTTNTMKKYMKCLGISFKNIKGDTDGD